MVFYLFGLINVFSQENQCYKFGLFTDIEYLDQQIYFGDTSIILQSDTFLIDFWIEERIDTRDELASHYACRFDFGAFPENIKSRIVHYYFLEDYEKIGKNLDYLEIDDCGVIKKYAISNSWAYRLLSGQSEYIELSDYFSYSKELILSGQKMVDTIIEIPWESTLEYEMVSENVLLKEQYTSLMVEPAIFDTAYHYILQETSLCDSAIIDTVSIDIVVKESFAEITTQPSEFETVTEMVLLYPHHTEINIHPRKKVRIRDTVGYFFHDSLILDEVLQNECTSNFLSGIQYHAIRDTFFLESNDSIYLSCPTTMTQWGGYCIEKKEVKAQYVTREYLKVKWPATYEATIYPALYTSYAATRITNKENIPESCIVTSYDTVAFQKLVTPASVSVIEHPATYGSRTYYRLISNPSINESNPPPDTNQVIKLYNDILIFNHIPENLATLNICLKNAISDTLVIQDYLESEDNNILEWYKGIIKYQKNNELKIGIIDRPFLEKLGIW